MLSNGSFVGRPRAVGWVPCPLGASSGSVGSQSGHCNLWSPSLCVNISHQLHLGWSATLRTEIPSLSVEKALKVASADPFPESRLCTHTDTPYPSLNTSPGRVLTTYKATVTIKTVYRVRLNTSLGDLP